MRGKTHHLLAVLTTLFVLLAVPLAAAAAPDPVTAMQPCLNGGYAGFERSDGSTFSTMGTCIGYTAHGGELFHPTLTITEPVPGPNHAEARIDGAGFHPNQVATVTLMTPRGPWASTIPTDASGAFSVTFGVYMYCGAFIPVTATDAWGVTASGSFTDVC